MDKIKSQRDEWISKSNADLDIPEDASLKVKKSKCRKCLSIGAFT